MISEATVTTMSKVVYLIQFHFVKGKEGQLLCGTHGQISEKTWVYTGYGGYPVIVSTAKAM